MVCLQQHGDAVDAMDTPRSPSHPHFLNKAIRAALPLQASLPPATPPQERELHPHSLGLVVGNRLEPLLQIPAPGSQLNPPSAIRDASLPAPALSEDLHRRLAQPTHEFAPMRCRSPPFLKLAPPALRQLSQRTLTA